jgi:hypothetical protein
MPAPRHVRHDHHRGGHRRILRPPRGANDWEKPPGPPPLCAGWPPAPIPLQPPSLLPGLQPPFLRSCGPIRRRRLLLLRLSSQGEGPSYMRLVAAGIGGADSRLASGAFGGDCGLARLAAAGRRGGAHAAGPLRLELKLLCSTHRRRLHLSLRVTFRVTARLLARALRTLPWALPRRGSSDCHTRIATRKRALCSKTGKAASRPSIRLETDSDRVRVTQQNPASV